MMPPSCSSSPTGLAGPRVVEPENRDVGTALLIALAFVALTRFPVARSIPFESDEFGFLELVRAHWFPMHHTLFLSLAKLLGFVVGDAYRGFIVLDVLMSALALTACWWWLRALTEPKVAISATLMLGLGPLFWGYGAVAGNYTAAIFVGSYLMGIAVRTYQEPRSWHPYAASAVLAFGAGYRSDIGTFWLPIYGLILWQHRWAEALKAGVLFVGLTLTWFLAMLVDVGGWAHYREASAQFAHSAGYLNSVWNLGVVDGAVRYSVKLTMALVWTLGPALLFAPRGLARIRQLEHGKLLAIILLISVLPALGVHLLVHFGSPGYAFHYVPALMAIIVIGIGRIPATASEVKGKDHAVRRLSWIAASLTLVFWFYPTNFERPGLIGSFDLAFARHTRAGLRQPLPEHSVVAWRTANSRSGHLNPVRNTSVR